MNQTWLRSMLLLILLTWTASSVLAGHGDTEIVKGSTIIGKPVHNMHGKKVGKIEDLAIDELDGEVRYAVLSFGGILGMGEKYFAIPWEVLTLSDDHKHFLLDVDERSLEHAPGFTKDKWPDFADPGYYNPVYDFYRVPVPERNTTDTTKPHRKPEKINKTTE